MIRLEPFRFYAREHLGPPSMLHSAICSFGFGADVTLQLVSIEQTATGDDARGHYVELTPRLMWIDLNYEEAERLSKLLAGAASKASRAIEGLGKVAAIEGGEGLEGKW